MNLVRYLISRNTHRLRQVPVLVLMPHSRCNCRCVMCDIWRANSERKELSPELLSKHANAIQALKVREVTLSGGEALLHSNLWAFCDVLKKTGTRISLLSTGLSLGQYAENILKYFDQVIVSLDGSKSVHDQVRNITGAFDKLSDGVKTLKRLCPGFRITGRCVVQRLNFRDLPAIISAGHEIGLDQMSFLPADVSSNAFNRPVPWNEQRIEDVALSPEEVEDLETVLGKIASQYKREFAAGFIAEPIEKFLQIGAYYRALLGKAQFPEKRCNAPWVSAVVESNGDVMPCFFHPRYGNINDGPLDEIINNLAAVQFRKTLDVQTDPVCRKCVCSLYRNPWIN